MLHHSVSTRSLLAHPTASSTSLHHFGSPHTNLDQVIRRVEQPPDGCRNAQIKIPRMRRVGQRPDVSMTGSRDPRGEIRSDFWRHSAKTSRAIFGTKMVDFLWRQRGAQNIVTLDVAPPRAAPHLLANRQF